MRQAGTISNREHGQKFVDYLQTLGIRARLDAEGDHWAIWIRDEDHMAKASAELEQFRQDPDSARYKQASQTAELLRKQEAKADAERRKNVIEMRNRWDTNPAGRKPLTMLLIGACVVVAILTELGENRGGEAFQALAFAPSMNEFEIVNPLAAIKGGQLWRLITPIFIHFGPAHLIFNMFWLYDFGSKIEARRGTFRFALLVFAVAVISNLGQYYFPRQFEGDIVAKFPNFGGMSGVVYGLFGYIWMKSRFDPLTNISISPNTVTVMLVWLVACSIGVIEKLFGIHVANWAHAVGLAVGMLIGIAPVFWRKFVQRK